MRQCEGLRHGITERVQRSYSNAQRKANLQLYYKLKPTSDKGFCEHFQLKKCTWADWKKRSSAILQSRRNGKFKTLRAKEAMYLKDLRRQEQEISMLHMVAYVQYTQPAWYANYMDNKRSAERGFDSLVHLLRAFCRRHGFSHRTACPSKLRQDDLEQIRLEFAADFYEKFHGYGDHAILNADETSIHFDMPSGFTWAEVGKSSKTSKSQKHSDRISVLLTVRADGSKLPLLFILRGVEDGLIDQFEVNTYPKPHMYVVQTKAWMDSRVWEIYLTQLLTKYLSEPSLYR
ncbi:hypothetical protein AeNC1_016405, partial [Aphanomyces euteiches]